MHAIPRLLFNFEHRQRASSGIPHALPSLQPQHPIPMRHTTHYNILICLALLLCACGTRTYAQDAVELPNHRASWYELRHFNASAELYRSDGITTAEKSIQRISNPKAPYVQRIALDSLGRIVRIEEFRDGDSLEVVTTIAYRGKRMEPASKTRCSMTRDQVEWHTRYAFDRKRQLRKMKDITRVDGQVRSKEQYTITRQANGLPAKTTFKDRDLEPHTTRTTRKDYVWKEQTRQLEVWEAGELRLIFEMNADLDAISINSAEEGRTDYMYENGRLVRMETISFDPDKKSTLDYVYNDRGLVELITGCKNYPKAGCKEIRFLYLRN